MPWIRKEKISMLVVDFEIFARNQRFNNRSQSPGVPQVSVLRPENHKRDASFVNVSEEISTSHFVGGLPGAGAGLEHHAVALSLSSASDILLSIGKFAVVN
jgi:hypothetical protein